MKCLPYAMELLRLTSIILIAALAVTLVMVTAPEAKDFENSGIMSKSEAELAQMFEPANPTGHWYDGFLNAWGDLLWMLDPSGRRGPGGRWNFGAPEEKPTKAQADAIAAQGRE